MYLRLFLRLKRCYQIIFRQSVYLNYKLSGTFFELNFENIYLAHVIEQPIFPVPNLEYLQQNFCFDCLMILRTHFEASLRFRKN